MKPPTHRQHGVTIIELIVAISVASLMMFLIHTIFNEITRTTRRGTHLAEFIRRHRAINQQLRFESELSLVNQTESRGRMVGPKGRDNDPTPGSEPGGFLVIINHRISAPLTYDDAVYNRQEWIRSDQLMFVLDQTSFGGKKRFPVLTPWSDDTFGGDMQNSISAEYVRIWYGHVQQMRNDGTSLKDNDDDLGSNVEGNPNHIAQDWALGRQALFLTDTPVGIHAQSSIHDPSATGPLANTWGISGEALYLGLTDVSAQQLQNLMDTVPNLATGQGFLGTAADQWEYQARVLGYMSFTNHRLRTSPKPLETNLAAADVAPMHTFFVNGVSDFIVEYAHDYFIGTSLGGGPDEKIDMVVHPLTRQTEIRWYSFYPNNPNQGSFDFEYPLVYRPPPPPPIGTNLPAHPGPIRISPPSLYDSGGSFVWQHEGSNGFAEWPWLIRVRYRLHDRRGELMGRRVNVGTNQEEEEPGRWFETIISVNRQPG